MAKGLDSKPEKACTRSSDLLVNCIRVHQILGVPPHSPNTPDSRPDLQHLLSIVTFSLQNERIIPIMPIWEITSRDKIWIRFKFVRPMRASASAQVIAVFCIFVFPHPTIKTVQAVGRRVQSDWWHSSSSRSIAVGWSETGIGGGWRASASESEILGKQGISKTGRVKERKAAQKILVYLGINLCSKARTRREMSAGSQ